MASAAERREQARHTYNANLAECPGHELLGILSDKWLTLVVAALADGPRRHSDLRRIVSGASQKMLTQTLRTCERNGLVSRRITPTVPPRVDYELTTLGLRLLPLQQSIKAWAEEHIADVHVARSHYDATVGSTSNPPAIDSPQRTPASVGADGTSDLVGHTSVSRDGQPEQ